MKTRRINLDVRGKACPQPVIEAKKALDQLEEGIITVLLDAEASAVNAMKAKAPPDLARLTFLGIGAAVMFLLTVVRYRVPWWPLHPLALPVGICSYSTNFCVFSIFLGWLAKWVLLKFGGNALYKAGRPFFLGIILGFFVGVGVSFVIDVIWFPGHGHSLYGY